MTWKIATAAMVALAAAQTPDSYLSLPNPITGPSPYWDAKGSTTFGDNKVVLTSLSEGNQAGALWSTYQNPLDEWTLEATLSVAGPAAPGGGLALWYAANRNEPGDVYGSKDNWDGLAIMLDSLGWDQAPAAASDEYGVLRGHLNDGNIKFKSLTNPGSNAFSLCRVKYRNTGAEFTISVGYGQGLLAVDVNGQRCFETDKVKLSRDQFFGISASSTASPDSFVIHRLEVYPRLKGRQQQQQEQQHQQSQRSQQNEQTQQQQQPQQPLQPRGVVQLSTDQYQELLKAVGQTNDKLKNIDEIYSNSKETAHLRSEIQHLEVRIDRMEKAVKDLSQTLNLDSRYAEQKQHVSKELGSLMQRIDKIEKAVSDHTSNLVGSFSDTVNTALSKGGSSIWVVFVLFICVQGAMFVGYSVYKTRRSYHQKIL